MEMVYCMIGVSFLFASIIMHFQDEKKDLFINFNNLLTEEQKKIYQGIVHERLMIYIMGMIFGISLGIYYLFRFPKDKYRICKFLAIVYLVKLGFYYFYPKKPLMLYSLDNQEQVNAWADIYTYMKDSWKKSLLLGLAGYILLSMYLCKKCNRK